MMALKLLPILQVIVILGLPQILAYPIYGTKRYGRGTSPSRAITSAGWPMPINYQQLTRNQRYPVNYYELYPYGQQNYPDDYYYPQESLSYPLYYPARTSKYEVYQAVLPYYYTETPTIPRLRYGIYGGSGNGANSGTGNGGKEPMIDLEEEILEEEREDRDEAQPIGHEMYYESDAEKEENFDDVNAAFLQNLIMSEMYKNALSKQNYYQGYAPELDLSADDDALYGKWEAYPGGDARKYHQEDEDVKELKQLSKARYATGRETESLPTHEERVSLFQQGKQSNKKTNDKNEYYWNNNADKRNFYWPSVDGKERTDAATTTTATTQSPPPTSTTTSTVAVKVDTRGQKEEVLMRPATPVRHPFSDLNVLVDGNRKRTPSVYETIKHMLDMEKNLDKHYLMSNNNDIKPAMKKRIVSNEDSLTQQLSLLKKN